MAGKFPARLLVRSALIFWCFLSFLVPGQLGAPTPLTANAGRPTDTWGGYPASSWALGIVVQEGAQLAGGGKVLWENVNNMTAAVRLPDIGRTDGTIYVILSVMCDDGSVLQVAAGIYPNSSSWMVYSDLVTNAGSISPTYQWVLNSSEPEMSPGAAVSISVFRSSANGWSLRVLDTNTGMSVVRAFPVSGVTSLKAGDQEVLALESYSESGPVFEQMGNLTLESLLIDGRRVSGGFYFYGGWTANRNPLFAVGSANLGPPAFIYLGPGSNGSLVWSYTKGWVGGGSQDFTPVVEAAILLLLFGSLVMVYLVRRTVTGMKFRGERGNGVPRVRFAINYPDSRRREWLHSISHR